MSARLENYCLTLQAEKQRTELQREHDDLGQRLDEAAGATQAQVGEDNSSCNLLWTDLHSLER